MNIITRLLVGAATFGCVADLPVAGQPTNPPGLESDVVSIRQSLGLPRLQNRISVGAPLPLDQTAFERVELRAAHVRSGTGRELLVNARGAQVLELEPGAEWSRPIRQSKTKALFISIYALASNGTVIDLAGATLAIESGTYAGGVQLTQIRSGEKAATKYPFNVHLPVELYSGKPFANLPLLTMRIEPAANVFDLYMGARLIASDLPLNSAAESPRTLSVRGGASGAWIQGIVESDENPLFEDANLDGVDDLFEARFAGGSSAEASEPSERRRQVLDAWQQEQRRTPPRRLLFDRIQPDRKSHQ